MDEIVRLKNWRKLNLGAGKKIIKGAINHDLHKHSDDISVAWDLNRLQWQPFKDESFAEILMFDVIEHLQINPIQALNECWRILIPNGILTIRYPVYTSHTIHDDPTHRWFLSSKALDYVVPTTDYGTRYDFYTPHKWEYIEKQTIKNRTFLAKMKPIK